MSTINGTIIGNETQQASQIPIVFKYQSNPALSGGRGIYAPDRVVQTNTVGVFSAILPMGIWDMTVGGLATYRIVVPDDTNTYNFSDIIDPNATVTTGVTTPAYPPLSGNGSPEEAVIGIPGQTYTNVSAASGEGLFYVKLTGTGNTGWQELISMP